MTEQITLAGGCFWCTESVYIRIPGVLKSVSCYANGTVERPTYQQVCTGTTGHAEVVQITFDPKAVTLEALLDVFWKAHDPTTLNQQGNDVGTQYRSGLYWTTEAQKTIAEASLKKAQSQSERKIVTEILPLKTFWPAEDYHQDYFNKNPNQAYCRAIIPPKLKKLGLAFAG